MLRQERSAALQGSCRCSLGAARRQGRQRRRRVHPLKGEGEALGLAPARMRVRRMPGRVRRGGGGAGVAAAASTPGRASKLTTDTAGSRCAAQGRQGAAAGSQHAGQGDRVAAPVCHVGHHRLAPAEGWHAPGPEIGGRAVDHLGLHLQLAGCGNKGAVCGGGGVVWGGLGGGWGWVGGAPKSRSRQPHRQEAGCAATWAGRFAGQA